MLIFAMSLSVVLLIPAIVLIRALALHKLPKITFLALWAIALSRLLIPFSIPSRFSIYNATNILEGLITNPDTSITLPNVTTISNVWTAQDIMINPASTDTTTVTVSPLVMIWLLGLVACALFFLVTHLRCNRDYKMALPVNNEYVNRWLQEHSARKDIQIRHSDKITIPLTYGIWWPVVLLPKTTDWSDETRLRHILAHEYVHIKRFDILSKWLLAAALCLHWFNPLVWLMYILANRDIELSCDETVVRTYGETVKTSYALTLIGLEERKSRMTPLCSNFSKNAIEERIISIMRTKKISFARIALALLIVLSVLTVFATNSALKGRPSQNGTTVVEGITVEKIIPDNPVEEMIVPNYTVNEQGETYGSAPYVYGKIVKEPDLISAIGVDGVKGYVKATDLNGPSFSSPEEAIAYQEKMQAAGSRSIPLYESDGRTEIGEFILGTGKNPD